MSEELERNSVICVCHIHLFMNGDWSGGDGERPFHYTK